MKHKMLVVCTLVGGAVMLGGCTGVQEDEPMPKNARISQQQEQEVKTEEKKSEPAKEQTEKEDVPVVEDPVAIDTPEEKIVDNAPEKKEEKSAEQSPAVEQKVPQKGDQAPAAKKQVRENDIEYIIRKGDTYSKISYEYGVPLKDLMDYNPYPEKRLIPGRKIMIPATGKKITKKAAPAVKVQKSYEPIPADGIYVVKKNDSYSRIASRYGLRASDIAEYNNLPLTKAIQPGQKLRLPPRRAVSPKKSAKKTAAKKTVKKTAEKSSAAPKAEQKPAETPVNEMPLKQEPAKSNDSLEELTPPSLDNISIPSASIPAPASDAAVSEIVTKDTTIADLAAEYACSEMDIRKQNPHLSADGIVKRGTKIVL